MNLRKLGKALLLPHTALLLLLLPVSTLLLVYSMTTLADTAPLRIASYVLAFYTLMIWCIRFPAILRFFRTLKRENRYMQRWLNDPRLRTNVTLILNVLWNGAYAALQLGMGIYHRAPWFYSLGAYYLSLAVMRSFLLRHTLRHKPGEKMHRELVRYRACGWIFLFMNLALSGMMLQMLRENRSTPHHEITTIAMAAYTFTTLTMAIINVIRYRKYNSPAMSASKAISLAAACVSMLTLENTMLTTFRSAEMTSETQLLFLGISGGAISILIIVMAIYMIVQSNQKIKCMENNNEEQ